MLKYDKIKLVIIKRKRLFISLALFVFLLYCLVAVKQIFPLSILLFIFPFYLLEDEDVEVGFIMFFVFFISSLAASKIAQKSSLQTLALSASVSAFYLLKNQADKKIRIQKAAVESEVEKLEKEILLVESNIKFYQTYISKKERGIELRKRIISFLREIENSTSDENVISNLIKAIKMLYPYSEAVFIVSPNTVAVEDIFRTKTPLFIADTAKDSRYRSEVWSDKERSVILLPIVMFSKTAGVLKVYASSEGYFTKDDFITLEIISTTASSTLENLSLYRNLDNLARRDALSGVFTRRIFDEKIDEEILVSARTRKPFCLLIVDIDHFKKINDTYGHQVGDEVIKRLASTLLLSVREFDFVARYGGEEFAVIMPSTQKVEAVNIAGRIVENVKRLSFSAGAKSFGITISGGVGEFPSEGQSKTQIIRVCDERLYAAKRAGRDRIVYE